MKRALFLSFCFVLVIGSCLMAGPVIPTDIDAQAVWYCHVDAEAIMQLPLVQNAHEKALKKKKKNHWAQICHNLGMQLMGEFLSATMYATQYEGDFGVVLLKFRNDLPKENLHAIFAQQCPQRKEVQIGNRKAYTWPMRCGRIKKKITGCFVDNKSILLGIDVRHVRNALEVLDGDRKGIRPDHHLFKGLTPGVLFISRAIDVPVPYQFSTYCPVLRHCHEAFARWTSFGDTMRGRYEFQTMNKETAALCQQAINGFKAIFQLRFGDYDQVLPLMKGFSNVAEGKAVILTWEGTTDQIKTARDQIRSKRRAMRKKRRQDNKK